MNFAPVIISTIFGVVILIFVISWMIQMLRLSRQKRILLSVQIKMFELYCQKNGIEPDLDKMYKEVLDNL
jgi:Holliday junction resolvase RusA-like endonuclease